MPSSPSSVAADRSVRRARRSTILAALVIGVPLASGILWQFHFGPLHGTPAFEYVKHPVEMVEVLMFCCALGALASKLLNQWGERRACRADALPAWDGQPVAVSEATKLMAELNRLPARLHSTWLARRVHGVLDFLCRRGSANELDDHLRDLADTDSVALENSYTLIRFITWAIPILGFLGTVLGITGAISGVNPDVLEHSLNQVTDGLATAFNATALALGLTMVVMFLTSITERAEQGVLETVDGYVDRHLTHRFSRTDFKSVPPETGQFVEVVRQNSQVLLRATEQLVQRQAEVWAKALEEADRRRSDADKRQQERITAALEQAMQRTIQAHSQRLAALEQETLERSTGFLERLAIVAETVQETGHAQQLALTHVAEGVAAQAQALSRLQDGERQLLRLQDALNQNLSALAAAGSFEQAVHSLTAAIHLLTARPTLPLTAGQTARPGKAA
jgi:biopolymer transport protein ExbB/TolQ